MKFDLEQLRSVTTGAVNDIEQATKLARAMICRYGMSDEFGMVALETVRNQYLGGEAAVVCSDETAARVDKKVVETVGCQYEKARELLKKHEKKLHRLARYLFDRETMTGAEFMDILNAESE